MMTLPPALDVACGALTDVRLRSLPIWSLTFASYLSRINLFTW